MTFHIHKEMATDELFRVHWEECTAPNLLDYRVRDVIPEKCLRRLMGWKSPCRPSVKSCHTHQGSGELQALVCLCGCQWWSFMTFCILVRPKPFTFTDILTPSIRSNSLQVCIFIVSPTNRLFQSHQQTIPVKTTPGTLRRMGLSWSKQHDFVVFIYLLTKISGKVCVFLFNSCVELYAKICTHCWNTNKSRRVFNHPVYSLSIKPI